MKTSNVHIGTQFENILELQCKIQSTLFIKIPLGCRRIGQNKIIPVKTPFDYVLIYEGQSVFLDCKSCDTNTFTYSQITRHQIDYLKKVWDHKCRSGYLVNFRKLNYIIFFDADKLSKLGPGDGLKPQDGQYLGGEECFALGGLFF